MPEQFSAVKNWRLNIYSFLTGQFVSGITSMIVQYAIIWYLTKRTGSATILSAATLVGMLPMVLLSPLVGPFVDRHNKKALLIIPDIVSALAAILLSIAGFIDHNIPIWIIFVVLFIRSVAQTFQMPTIQSMMPTMVPQDQLTRVNGQLGVVQNSNLIIAPALGALLFAIIPLPILVLLDPLGAMFATPINLWIKIPERPIFNEKIKLLADVKFGLTKLKSKRGLWMLTLLGTLYTLFFMPATTMYPLMTMSYFHGTVGEAGIIEGIFSAGMLLGGGIIGLFGKWKDRVTPILWSMLFLGVAFIFSGNLPGNFRGLIWFGILNAIAGIASPFFSTLLIAMLQQSYPSEILGRIMGIFNSLMNLSGPVGLIFAGPLADSIGVNNLFVVSGIGTLLCGLLVLTVPLARRYDAQLQETIDEEK
ncbi:MFS transporter [Companilactobacillus sp.]|uniref:MFS transporter n=1 Tax=Companilactobacillus sp. TaxID=2767905 RepID=UPI0025B85962|nr:MFS transporter [Companilactobacillus sp.]MCH4009780.1 MFS transporter [Companilactobacillus sp.]MCH4052544.1 MFS transporter [Companilactobacillus sp.]MCH4077722.1 MFS transporter [Companilactobacillus sp.]MCH4126298.1 MFS transporter [Companilactobacillus sp.]MCI1312006.1 MFS transporter [Companilactobacillus sp.]